MSESEAKEPVESIVTPTRTTYTVTPGPSQQKFLRAIAQGRILGETCPQCQKVDSPPSRARAPCGVAPGGAGASKLADALDAKSRSLR